MTAEFDLQWHIAPTETGAGHASVVGNNSQVLDLWTGVEGVDQGVRDTREAETTDQQGRRTLDVLDSILCGVT
jgi:hypothetical protein